MAMVPINGDRLHKAITASGHTLVSASKAISRGEGYLSNAKHRGKIDSLAAEILEARLNVPKDLYLVPEGWKPEEPEQLTIDTDAVTLAEILRVLGAIHRELVNVVDYLDDQAKQANGWPEDPDF